ncbi:MAG TPA: SxtJ family membrane protein [Nitrospinota bacterium]|nr:SxtJ family membrane protein [Nitrospinota bacterium]|tara:strand:- start:29535 stop:29930 length:396 start_codon:yes stop_codon:yes gene_type:complete
MAIGETLREVRNTWIGFASIFAVLASIAMFKGKDWHIYLYTVSVFFAFFAIVAPMALISLYRYWVKFAMGMAWFNTRLLLCIVYYFVITPFGLVMRIFGADLLDEKINKTTKTYWKKKEQLTELSRYEKQY